VLPPGSQASSPAPAVAARAEPPVALEDIRPAQAMAAGMGPGPVDPPNAPSQPAAPQGEVPTTAARRNTGGASGGNGGNPEAGVLTIVLDPGHGGHDTGAIGPSGLMEKDVVLDLALRLRRLLMERLGARVLMTRTEDVFIPLPERTAFANRAKADFFVSLHANAATKRNAVGFETYYFTREPSDSDARASAQRENLVIESDGARGSDQESLLRITLADMAVSRDMRESGEMAEFVLTALDKLLRVENRGVKSGPFYVLATAAMPAILVESAFITNPREERRLQRSEYRQRIAEALFEGIAKYKVRYDRRVGMAGAAVPPRDS
jgi:N-acetylmuramoyl-L-alanine amidase